MGDCVLYTKGLRRDQPQAGGKPECGFESGWRKQPPELSVEGELVRNPDEGSAYSGEKPCEMRASRIRRGVQGNDEYCHLGLRPWLAVLQPARTCIDLH
jgi:hypothetical protein